MKVCFLTEYGGTIGSGHLVRALSLSEAFEERGIQPSVWVSSSTALGDDFGDRSLQTLEWYRDRKAMLTAIERSDIVIVDSYFADEAVYGQIAATCKLAIYLDDEKRLNYPAGMVVNGAIGAEMIDYPEKKETRYLLSTPYIPLRRAFWALAEKKINDEIVKVLLTFGGSDPRALTPKILRLLCDHHPHWSITVVIGKDFDKNLGIDEIGSRIDCSIKQVFNPNATQMRELMLTSDLVFSAGGQTVYECAQVGVPLIAVSVSQNQSANVSGGQTVGFLEYAGAWDDADLREKVLAKIDLVKDKAYRKEMSHIGRQCVDGLGSLRVVNAIFKDFLRTQMRLRPARHADLIDVYTLANDPEVRAFSFHRDSIPLEVHTDWYANQLKNPNVLFFVAEAGDCFLGQTRFDLEVDGAVVSIAIAKRWRGLNLGKQILRYAIACLKEARPEISSIKAYIKVENAISNQLFSSCGFKYLNDVMIENQKAKAFLYSIETSG